MKKKILVLVVVVLLLALTIQVAFAAPPPDDPDNIGSCHMGASWWEPGTETFPGPGNGGPTDDDGVPTGERGMYNVHFGTNPSHGNGGNHPQGYTNGATNMDNITEYGPRAHCAPEEPPK